MFSIIHTYIHSHILIRIHIFTHDLLAQRSIGKYITEKKYVCVYVDREKKIGNFIINMIIKLLVLYFFSQDN